MEDSVKKTEEAVFVKTGDVNFLTQKVAGYDWNQGIDYGKLLKTYIHSGFQATNFGLAVKEINKMLECRKLPIPEEKFIDTDDPFTQIKTNCTIFLGYTSNMVSCGLRETIRFLVQHKLVQGVDTSLRYY